MGRIFLSGFVRIFVILIGAFLVAILTAASAEIVTSAYTVSPKLVFATVFIISFVVAIFSINQATDKELNFRALGIRYARLMETKIEDLLRGNNSVTVPIRPSKPNLMSSDEARIHLGELPTPPRDNELLKVYVTLDTRLITPDTEYRQENIDEFVRIIQKEYSAESQSGEFTSDLDNLSIWFVISKKGKLAAVLPDYRQHWLGELLRERDIASLFSDQIFAFSDQSPAEFLSPDPINNTLSTNYFLPVKTRGGKFKHVLLGSEMLAELAAFYGRWKERPLGKRDPQAATSRLSAQSAEPDFSRGFSVKIAYSKNDHVAAPQNFSEHDPAHE